THKGCASESSGPHGVCPSTARQYTSLSPRWATNRMVELSSKSRSAARSAPRAWSRHSSPRSKMSSNACARPTASVRRSRAAIALGIILPRRLRNVMTPDRAVKCGSPARERAVSASLASVRGVLERIVVRRARRLLRAVFATEEDRAVRVLRLADSVAELHEIVVGVDDRALHRAARVLVVAAPVERHPPAAEFLPAANVIPGQALHELLPCARALVLEV